MNKNDDIKGAVFSSESFALYKTLFARCEYCGSVIIHTDDCKLNELTNKEDIDEHEEKWI